MAQNPAAAYGRDVACVEDADEFFTDIEGLGVVMQDAIHRITTDSVAGDSEEAFDWGYDCRRLLGMPADELAAMPPILVEVLTRDDRIDSAEVTLTATTTRGLADIEIAVTCTTAAGPFSFVKSVLDLTGADLGGTASL